MPPRPRPRTLLFVAPWEASRAVTRVPAAPTDRVVVCFVESQEMGARLPWHRHKLVLVLSAMRHFADELRAAGHAVDYRRADDYAAGVLAAARAHGAERVVATRARDWYVGGEWARLRAALADLPRPPRLELREDPAFLVTPEQFGRWALRHRERRFEAFYEAMRRRYGVLLDARGRPEGDQWHYDHENRKPWPKGRPAPAVWSEPPDARTRRVAARVARWPWCWGAADGFALPVTRDGALAWLERFAAERLPEFGPYEDAMVDGAPDLLHSTLAPLLNVGLLHPLEVVRRAERAYRDGAAPLASVEGFVRQVLGWREYVRGMYWLLGPEFERANALRAARTLPRVFWAPDGEAYGDGSTPPAAPDARPDPALAMRCLTDAVRHVRDRARVHHIPRLMVQANFATLLGVRPQDLNRWFWAAFTDAAHWVTTPNVVGMGTWGDGGRMMTKPYVASGAYVRRMGDHCGPCAYDPTRRSGPGACPLNTLYWDFVAGHRARFLAHPRLGVMVQQLDRIPPGELAAVRADAAAFRDAVAYDAPYEPAPVRPDALVTTWNAPHVAPAAARPRPQPAA
ncbi:deoxyribodipyrimidine photo-lyase [Gemmatimonadetes bacterium T265]|nr:deoxyribodipyrimidine photo-lyase [Gemmatimonadetes bacterium T265]